MTIQLEEAQPHSRRLWRSAAAIFSGFVAVVVLSLATDQIMHEFKIFPPWGEPMHDPGLNLLALSYRIIYTVIGGHIAAKFAPSAPLRHAVILGLIGLVPGFAGVIATSGMDLGPRWFPIAIALTGLPCCWHGGVFREVVAPERLVFTFAWEEEGERGLETLVTVTFADEGGKTRMTFRQEPFQSTAERDGHGYGWGSSFDRLDEQFASPGSFQ